MNSTWRMTARGWRLAVAAGWGIGLATLAAAQTPWYVATNGTGDGSTWETAAGSIQAAIDAASPNDTIWVSNGVYEAGGVTNYPAGTLLTNRVAVWKALTVRSANNDPTNTIIKGAWASDGKTNGPDAVRCAYLTNGAWLIGFTLADGATMGPEGATEEQRGAGAWCEATGAVLTNCILIGNAARRAGGGILRGTLYNCGLVQNIGQAGAGAYLADLWRCMIVSNTAIALGGDNAAGAGACLGTLRNCTLMGNKSTIGAVRYGGGTYYSDLFNCVVISNSAEFCGGIYGGAASNCHVMYNIGTYGSGARAATLYNCLLAFNKADWQGGGGFQCTMYNCTVVSNKAFSEGGGCYGGTRYNCISWGNNLVDTGTNYYFSCGVGYTNHNSTTNNPLFADSANGNFRLSPASPCINAGSNQAWMGKAVDLDGNRRIATLGGAVDMGAFEYPLRGALYIGR